MSKSPLTNYVLLGGIGVIWGSQFVLNEMVMESFPPLTVAAGRLGIGLVTLSLLLGIVSKKNPASERREPQPWGRYGAIALFEGILPCVLIPWGQQRVDSSIAAILMATIPFFTLLLATTVVRDESWSFTSALAVFIGFGGVVILLGPHVQANWFDNIIGELAILVGSFSFAISLILIRGLPPLSPVLTMRNVLLIAAIPMVALACIVNRPWELEVTWTSLMAILTLGTFCGGIVYVMLTVLISRAGTTFTSLYNYLVVLVGVFIGIIVLGEKLTGYDIMALLLILFAIALSQWRELFKGGVTELQSVKL